MGTYSVSNLNLQDDTQNNSLDMQTIQSMTGKSCMDTDSFVNVYSLCKLLFVPVISVVLIISSPFKVSCLRFNGELRGIMNNIKI